MTHTVDMIVCRRLSSYLFGVQTTDVPDMTDADTSEDELNRADTVRFVIRLIYVMIVIVSSTYQL